MSNRKTKKAKSFLAVLLSVTMLLSSGASSVYGGLGSVSAADPDAEAFCGYTEHEHDDECYEDVLVCGMEEGHIHTDACYETVRTLICGLEESEGHTHADSCYDVVPAQLVCGMEESAGHAHEASCYDEEGNLICGQQESEGHVHTDACYSEPQRILICGLEESEGHVHTDACYETEQVLICGLEEADSESGHVHTDDCYEKTLTCTLEEHEHDLSCYSNPNADVETASTWEATLPGLTGVWRDDVVAVAKSQIGYTESTLNYEVVDGKTKGYTRYGAWYGSPYEDWCAMFASFCLYYAGVPASVMPEDAEVTQWISDLSAIGQYAGRDYEPEHGDLVFFDLDGGGADHVGIVEGLSDDGTLVTIEGNSGNAVRENTYNVSDSSIIGYGVLPEQPGVGDEDSEYDQKVSATIYTDGSYETVLNNGTTITLQGEMPADAAAKAYPVDVEIDDVNVLAAYDITIFDEEGEEYEPKEDHAIEVTFDNEEIREALAEDRELTIYHMDDVEDEPEKIAELSAQTETVMFMAEHFSIYIVGEDGSLTDEDGEEVDAYTVNFYQWVYNDTTLSDDTEPIITQTVVGDDYIIEPEVPEIANHMFDGWFTEKQDKNHYDDGEYPGYQFDFSKTVNENLVTWTDGTVGEDNVINLYSDYDPAYYVYYMTEEREGFNSDVVFTDVYHVDEPVLNTSNAEYLFRALYVSKFVDFWYYYDENNMKQTIQSGDTITGDLTIYPVMSDAIWVYFEMGTGDDEKVQAIDPIHIENSATEFGELPVAERAGYEFEGWYTLDGTEVTEDTDPQSLVDEETGWITLYADWTPAAVAYTVNIWRQKATDGKPGIDQKTVQGGEEYSTYINYYDYSESYTVSAEQSQLKTGDTPTTDTVYDWNTLIGYGWNDSSDGTGDYEGFEYNQTRTENDLATITMQPDGSTIINIFYDRVTVTYNFTYSNTPYGTLVGLYDTNTKVADDVDYGGTLNGWPDPGEKYCWNYSSSLSANTIMSFLAKFALTENTSNRSNEVDFTSTSTSYSYTLYYYLEVTDPDRQVNASSTTITADNVTYVLDQAFSVGTTNRTSTFNFTSKYIGYEFYGYNTNGGTSITTDESSTSVSNNGSLYIFNKALEYDIELYSNHNGEQLVWSGTYKYGAPLSSVEFPSELDAETYGPANYYHFTGTWYEDPTFTAVFQKPDTMPHYNLVAYADWEPNIVTVTFQSNIASNLYDVLTALYGEENVTTNGEDPWSYSITVTVGDQLNYDLDDGLTANVEEHNYQYVCWMNTGTNEVFNFMNYIYEDTTLQVFWVEEIEYFLRYNINNEAYADTEAVLGHAHQSSSYAEVRKFTDIFEDISDDGFIRWASESDGSGDSYYPDDQVDFTQVTSEPVFGVNDEGEQVVKYYVYDLYAIWAGDRVVSLTLDYNYPEGYEGEKTENATLDDLANLEQVDLSDYEPGETSIKVNGFTYTFAGWAYTADAGEAAIDADGTVAADNIGVDEENDEINILYAVWERAETFDVPIYKYDPDRRRAEYISAGIDPYEVTNYGLEDAEFVLSRSDDGTTEYVIAEKSDSSRYYTYTVTGWTSDEDEATALASNLNGYIEITNLEAGTYTLTETKAPEGYKLLEESIVFTVDSEGNLSVVSGPAEINNGRICIANTEITGAFELEKKDEGGNTLSGAKFILGAYADNSISGYQSNAETYAVTDDGQYEYYYFKLNYDDESGSYVWDSDYWYDTQDEATVMTTGTDGTLKISKLMTSSMLGGTYFLIETEAPEGYDLLADPIVFTVSDDGTIQIAVSNDQASMNDDGTVMTVIDDETPNPSISVEKTAIVDENYKAKLGDKIDYEITVTNDGNVTLENITVKDTLNGDTWTIDELSPNESKTLTTTYVVTEADILAGHVANVATATAPNPNYDPDDPDSPENIEDEDTEDVPTEDPDGHLTVYKTVDNEPKNGVAYDLGEEIIWKVTVKNDGNLTITDIVVTDEKTGGSWEVGTLAPGEESEAFSTSYTVTEEDIENGSVLNVATATGKSPDPENPDVPVTPGEDEEPTVNPYPSLYIEKTAQVDEGHEAVLGEEITYEITVTNNGNETLTGITVKDTLNGDTWTIDELHPNESETFTTIYVVTEDDIIAGHVANVATATAPNPNYDPDDPDSPENIEDEDTEDVPTEDPNGHLTVTKVVDNEPANGVAYALGEEIIWKVSVKNDGNLTITDIVLTDEKTGDSWEVGTLAPGEESEAFSTSYIVTEEDIENGSVLNVATAKGISPDPENPDVPVTPGEDEEPSYHYFPLDEEIVPNNDDVDDPDSWIKRESVNEYDAIEIEMSTTLPKMDGATLAEGDYSMTFHNQLDTALVLDDLESDFKVYIGNVKIDEKYYEIDMTQTNRLLQFFSITDGCAFHVDVDLSALYNDGVIGEEDLGTTPIRVFFYVDLETTDVNSSYVSTAWYDLLSEGEVVFTSDTSTVAVYTFEIIIDKYDTETNDPLSDATFGLYYDESCENPVSRNEEDYVVTTDEDGQAMFVGIAEGTYYVKELEAPEGYDLIEKPVTVALEGSDDDDEVEHDVDVPIGNTPSEDERDNPKDPVKTADVDEGASVKVGDEITYSISYYNNNDNVAAVTIKDVLDEGVDYVSSDPEGEYDADTHTVIWDFNAEAYEEGSVQLTVKVNENAGSEVKNTASVQIGDDPAVDTNEVDIPVEPEVPESEIPETEAPETEAPDTTSHDPVKSVDVGNSTTEVGQELTYTITYYNHYSESTTVTVADRLDTGLEFVSASDGGVYDEYTRTVSWTVADTAPLTEGSVTLTVKVTEDALTTGSVENVATVRIGNDDAVATNLVSNPVVEEGTSSVKTGDTTPLGPVAGIMAMALALMAGTVVYRKKRTAR